MFFVSFFLIALVGGCSQKLRVNKPMPKERPLLIEFGMTTPDTRHMRQNVAYYEEYLPLDGLVFNVQPDRYAGRYGDIYVGSVDREYLPLEKSVFCGDQRVKIENFTGIIEDLQNTPFKKFKHNFLALYFCAPGAYELDWFDDEYWDTVCYNVGVLAKIAKQSGCVGIWFDNEMYGENNIWNYLAQKAAYPDRPQSFDAYRRQVRERARQFIEAINAEFPDIDLVLVFGSSLMHARMAGPDVVANLMDIETDLDGDFSRASEVLMAPFIDGLLENADERTEVIDGYELSYYYKTDEQFQRANRVVRQECKRYSQIPELYAEKIGLGLGLFPTHPPQQGRNFTSEELTKSVELAMKYTDKYVWLYAGYDSFWIKGGHAGMPIAADFKRGRTAPGTIENSIHDPAEFPGIDFRGISTEFIDAIAEGKEKALKYWDSERKKK